MCDLVQSCVDEKQLARFTAHPDAAAKVAGPALATSRVAVTAASVNDSSATGSSKHSTAASPDEAHAVAERAAWTMVANALLNLDEAVTK